MVKRTLISIAVVAIAFIAIIALFLWGAASPTSAPSGSTPPANEGILKGQVLLGPTCPVEQNPPLPGCAPKPYATTILVYFANDNTKPYAAFATDASGTFSAALPAGAYVVQAAGGSPLPRCGSTEVTLTAGMTATTTLSCDTGIR
jgi:hypothetical protein